MVTFSMTGNGRRRARRRRGGIIAAVAVATIVLASCSGGGDGGTGPTSNGDAGASSSDAAIDTSAVLRVGLGGTVPVLNPGAGTGGGDQQILYLLYDRLTTFDPETGEVLPNLAKSWEFSDDGTEFRMELETGVMFHDGTELDAEAVAFSLDYYKELGVQLDLAPVESVEVVSPTEVLLHLSRPYSSLPAVLGDRAGMIVSPTAVETLGEGFAAAPVGTGPYRFASQVAGSSVSLERFDDYWKGEPRLAGMTITTYSDETARLAAAQSGQLDVAITLGLPDVETARAIPGMEVIETPSLRFGQLFLNSAIPPFNDPNVRLALNHAVDRQAYVDAVTEGLGAIAFGPFPESSVYFNSADAFPYDLDEAKALMAKSGSPAVDVSCLSFNAVGNEVTGPLMVAQAKEIGINMRLDVREPAAAIAAMATGDESCLFSAWTGRPDPAISLNSLYSSTGTYNYGQATHGRIDELLAIVDSTFDQDERAAAIRDVVGELTVEAPHVPLYVNPLFDLVGENVVDWEPNFQGKVDFSGVALSQG
ncbi:ABC transporter substrate-binding protein [Microbacterium sp. No. 7]|uniref:ABC transporter substrate-binding protein n=1 Tax=Microbacterium sp. No. 7 TaxID=1714373 RepID=UPI0006CF7F51|nr:ABC transporter substrate-binding protein [Microbacterium sp. No. 7]ALJ21904.1 hypothetical protein AOA12_19170 [Microbacterium sp. No. 7]